jgi:hypothetical protein
MTSGGKMGLQQSIVNSGKLEGYKLKDLIQWSLFILERFVVPILDKNSLADQHLANSRSLSFGMTHDL